MKREAVKILHCTTTAADTIPIRHLSEQLNALMNKGWSPRYAHFDRRTGFVYLEHWPKARAASNAE